MVGKVIIKTYCLCLLFCLVCLSSTSVFAGPTTLGPILFAADGSDPDIALDSEGTLHLAYVRSGVTHYRKVIPPYALQDIGKEFVVGNGTNPQIAVDSKNNPHVVFSKAHYAYWTGNGFKEAEQAFDAWRKNLIAIDGTDRVYIVADKRNNPRGVLVRVYKNGVPLNKPFQIGGDDPGGIAFDADDTLHFTWRDSYTHYDTYRMDGGLGGSTRLPNFSGDFSWCSVDPVRKVIHTVYTAAYAKGVYHTTLKDGKVQNTFRFGLGETQGMEPDNMNPVSSNDAQGYTYVTFRGRYARGYYSVIDENDKIIGGIYKIDPVANSNAGAKMTNPNVASHPLWNGAFVSWGTSKVQIRSIGDISSANDTIGVPNLIYDILMKNKKESADDSE